MSFVAFKVNMEHWFSGNTRYLLKPNNRNQYISLQILFKSACVLTKYLSFVLFRITYNNIALWFNQGR